MDGTVYSVSRQDEATYIATIKMEDGSTQEVAVAATDGKLLKQLAVGNEVTFGVKKKRKPRATNGKGKKPGRKGE